MPTTVAEAKPESESDDDQVRIIGNKSNFWLWRKTKGFDLTRYRYPYRDAAEEEPDHGDDHAQPRITMQTTNSPIEIAPGKTALVIVDMQNFFLSRSLGRKGQCHDAEDTLLKYALPAARKAGIQVIWLNWGLTESDLETMSPTMLRLSRFRGGENPNLDVPAPGEETPTVQRESMRGSAAGMGNPLGEITLIDDGRTVDMGRLYMRGHWNAALHRPLENAFQESLQKDLPDVKLHKNRISGVCDSSSELVDYLNSDQQRHIRTLLFAGVNTDRCVFSTLHDSNLKGYDTILLKDGCGTASPDYASRMALFNCARVWGFVSTCQQLAYGVEHMLH